MSARATKPGAARGSRLLSLPPEIVNRIFSCLVPEPIPTNAAFWDGHLLSPQDLDDRDALNELCRVSKQCHQIASPLLYRNITVLEPFQLIKLFYALVLNDMGPHVRHFAFVLEDPKESWFDGHFRDTHFELLQMLLRLTPETRPKFERLYPDLFLGKSTYITCPDRFFVHLTMLCVNLMTRGQDILLGLPCDVAQRDVGGLPPAQHTYNSPHLQHHSWKSFRLQCDSQLITADPSTFQFLRQLLSPETTRVEVFNYSEQTGGWEDLVSDSFWDTYQLLGDSPCLCRVEEVKVYINDDFDTDCLEMLMDRAANVKRVTVGFPGYENRYRSPTLQRADAEKFYSAISSRAGQIEYLHIYTQSYGVLPLNIGMLPGYTSLKSLRVDLPLLLGNPDTWDKSEVLEPITTMFKLLPPSIESLTLKEKWPTEDLQKMLTHKGSEIHFLEIFMDGVLLALVEDCSGNNLPALKEITLEAYDRVESSGSFRKEESMIAYEDKFRDCGVVFHWVWHHDVHDSIKCAEIFSKQDLSRWRDDVQDHIYPYYT